MIETAYFLILGTQVYMKGWAPAEKDILVPEHIVTWCGKLNNVDVYNLEVGSVDELKLLDCYSFRLNYYDTPVTPINRKIHWKFY